VAIKNLISVVPPPARPTFTGTPEELTKIQAKLGTPLPYDYRELTFRYGAGRFLDGYLQVLTPFAVDLREYSGGEHSSIQVFHEMGALPWPPFPASPGLLAIGGNENGHQLLYLTEGKPNDWPVIVVPHGAEAHFERWDLPLTKFLAEAIRNRIKTCAIHINAKEPVRPEDRTFTPLPPSMPKGRKRR
jgi:hypothetical protein